MNAVSILSEVEKNGTTARNKILRVLRETYGAEAVVEWGTAIMDALQQTEVLRSGLHEQGEKSEAQDGDKLDGNSLPCPAVVTEWIMRDLREQQECGCSPQGREPDEQRNRELAEIVSQLPHESAQAAKVLFDMWASGKGVWVLRQTLSALQKVRQSAHSAWGIVRRLTPEEAELLQGFPKNWTDIGEWVDENGKKHQTTDSARYRALGNSICTPFWFWLMRRISAQYERPATLGSLFDGIGGFPYCWERCNGEGTAVWASEIEPFCIAVTKKHFPESGTSEESGGRSDGY